MLIAQGAILFSEHKHDSTHVEVHKSRLELVLALLDHGSLGGGLGHGCAEHRAALVQIIGHAGKIIAKIDNPPPPSCNKHKDCNRADADAERLGQAAPHHCHIDDCEECFGC